MRVMLTGAHGQAGRALASSVPSNLEIVALGRRDLDIADAAAVERVVSAQEPAVIINAAAYTDVERAEHEPSVAARVNTDGPRHLARVAKAAGARLVHISTDYVFDGKTPSPIEPDHPANPLNAYGRGKRDGENCVLEELGDAALIVRTSWLYYRHGRNFVETMLTLMRKKAEIRVVSDQFSAPTAATTLADLIWVCVDRRTSGIVHCSDSGIASWYDFAVAIAETGLSTGRLRRPVEVVPITTAEYPTRAPRPAFSLLDTRATRQELGFNAGHWRANLKIMLESHDDA